MRTIGAPLTSHLASTAHQLNTMLLFILRDGTTLGVTDHDRNIDYDLTDAGVGTVTYRADTGIIASDVVLSTGLDSGNFEITGPIGSVVSLQDVLGGRFDRATAYLFKIKPSYSLSPGLKQTVTGAIKIVKGSVGSARPEGGKFVIEVRDLSDAFNQTIGRIITNMCDADYGDGIRCHATAETVTGTVTAVSSAMGFTVSYSGSFADAYFDFGTVEFTTGVLANALPMDIQSWTAAGAVVTFSSLVDLPAIGDTCTIRRGCPKSRLACMERGQILNFGGFPEVPGSDQALPPALPGQGDQ